MSITEQNEPAAAIVSPSPIPTATVVVSHEGADGMGERSMTVGRYEEIRRRLADGRGVREIARALGCARATVREVRDGLRHSPDTPKPRPIRCGCGSWSGRRSCMTWDWATR